MALIKGTQNFECSECGAKYVGHYTDYPMRDKGSFTCECGTQLHRWNGSRDWTDFVKVPDDE
jgi:hypothetical protein